MKALFGLIFCVFTFVAFGQKKTEYDVIYMKDGRVLYGEIINFEMKDGDITFKDRYGRMYSLTREEYKYFIEDQVYKEKVKDTIINTRKYNDYEFEVGIAAHYFAYNHSFSSDAYYLESSWNGSYGYIPINIHAGFGKYFKRKLYAGIEVELTAFSAAKSSFLVGLAGRYQYDSHSSNVAKYISFMANYQATDMDIQYQVADSIDNGGIQEYPGTLKKDISFRGYNLGIGHGFQFQFLFMRSLSLELGFYKQIGTKYSLLNLTQNQPQPHGKFSGFGARFMVAFHF